MVSGVDNMLIQIQIMTKLGVVWMGSCGLCQSRVAFFCENGQIHKSRHVLDQVTQLL